jgi:predicted nucleic acid-binding protein
MGLSMRLYLDTSVLGAMFDDEPPDRKEKARLFFQRVKIRKDTLYISDVVLDEIARAPERLQFSLNRVVKEVQPLVLPESGETLALAQAYVESRVVPVSSRDDARHVAIATVAGMEALVSWNFKHIVNVRRRRLVHSVNIRLGYPLIELVSPEEVLYE